MPDKNVSILPVDPQFSKQIRFREWRDALLLREYQAVKAPSTEKARRYLAKVATYGCGPFMDIAALALAGKELPPKSRLANFARSVDIPPLENLPAVAKRLRASLYVR
jgi:hypothetical protein